MSDREIIYFNKNLEVVNIVVVGLDDPDNLLELNEYSSWIDREDAQHVSIGWKLLDGKWIPPQPFESWLWINENWEPPIEYPSDGKVYEWDEELINWKEKINTDYYRQSAINKLTQLGLTEEEALAIIG